MNLKLIIKNIADEYFLTKREQEVYYFICQGMTPVVISEQLQTETSTIRKHINNIYNKIGINNINELLSLVIMKGIND